MSPESFLAPFAGVDAAVLLGAAAVMLLAGFVKGAVGFALPMIAVSGIGSFLTAQETIAVLILPTLMTNIWQSLRQGIGEAGRTARRFWKLMLVMVVVIVAFAQVVPDIPSGALFVALGLLVTTAAAIQLAGWRPRIPAGDGPRLRAELLTGVVAGILGGLAAIWGPAIVLFLVALGVEKTLQVRAQGLSFMAGSLVLVAAHLESGILNAETLPLSAIVCIPAAIGMALGLGLQDRLEQATFRKITLVVLCLAGLNILRRGLMG